MPQQTADRPREGQALRLLAQDADDLQVISAALQDAVAQVGDFRFDASARRFTAAFNRLRREGAAGQGGAHERVRTGLQLGGVLNVQARKVRREPKDAVVSLLSVAFEPAADAEDPGGTVTLAFAGGGDLRLAVEALDVVLADVSQPWPTRAKIDHG